MKSPFPHIEALEKRLAAERPDPPEGVFNQLSAESPREIDAKLEAFKETCPTVFSAVLFLAIKKGQGDSDAVADYFLTGLRIIALVDGLLGALEPQETKP